MAASRPLRHLAAVLCTGLVVTACGPRFDISELEGQAGSNTVQVPLAGGQTGDGTTTTTDPTLDPGFATDDDTLTTPGAEPAAGGDAASGGQETGDGTSGDTGDSTDQPADTGSGGGGDTPSAPAAGQDPGPAPGVTDTPCKPSSEMNDAEHIQKNLGCIKIGVLVPETGAAPVPSDFKSGVSLFFWEKAKAGGTNGRQVQLIVRNTDSKESTARSQAQKLLQEGVFTVVSLDRLEVHKALGDFMEQANVPHVMVQAPTPYPTGWKNTFTISIDHTRQGRAIMEYWATDLKAANGAKKVAIVREQTPSLKPGVDAAVARAKDFDVEITNVETIDPSSQTFNNLVLKICPATGGPEIVWLYMAPTPALTIMNQAATQGCNPKWFANSISWNLDLAQANPAAPSDSGAFSPWVSVQSPRAARYRAAFEKYNSTAPDDLGLASWGLSEVVDSALAAAGPNLGHDTFRSALQNLKVDRYETWGPIDCTGGPPYVCSEHVAVYGDDGTKWKLLGDFRTFQ